MDTVYPPWENREKWDKLTEEERIIKRHRFERLVSLGLEEWKAAMVLWDMDKDDWVSFAKLTILLKGI